MSKWTAEHTDEQTKMYYCKLQSTAPDTSTHKGDVCPFSTQTQLPDLIAK